MNSSYCQSEGMSDNDALSQAESRELLGEVCAATEGTSQVGLFEFASILCQLLDRADGDTCQVGEVDPIPQFVATGINEIRQLMNDGRSTSTRLESLRDNAIDRWGHLLSIADQDDFEDNHSEEFDHWQNSEDSTVSDEMDLFAPSAEDIRSLLSQLGQPANATTSFHSESAPPIGEAKPFSGAAKTSQAGANQLPAETPQDTSVATIQSLDPELREAFMDDASGCISSMETALLSLEANPQNSDSVNQICRELHTLKGASGSVGLTDLADQLHELEDRLRDDLQAGNSPNIGELLKSVDSIRSQLVGSDPPPALASTPTASGVQQRGQDLPCVMPTPTSQAFDEGSADDESVRVQSSQLNRLMDMLAELVMLRNRRETELSDLQEVYRELIGSVSKMRLLSHEAQGKSSATGSLQLSEIANDVLEVAQHVRDCARPVAEGNTAVSQFIRQFRQELVELRRTPIGGLFRRLQRVVRDAAQAESKNVRLQLIGEDAGIERSLQQRLYEPLLHIVRNSVCHGIESVEQRARSGKPATGTITLEAKAGPDLFVIEIRDDGGGLDYDAIRRRGIDSGLLSANQTASRQELSQLIFHPGFSTRDTASQVAGRGVGMDVVASTLKRMRGWLEVDSQPLQGTRIRLSFPLPSVIQHVMVFRCAGRLFALPMQSVQSAGELAGQESSFSFADFLGCQRESATEPCQRIMLACDDFDSQGGVSQSRRNRVSLLVDEIVGPEEVVVRPLPALLKQHPFCAGATLSGMGQIVLLLDARRVIEFRNQAPSRHDDEMKLTTSQTQQRPQVCDAVPRVLVVDDSLSARKRVVRSLSRYPVEVIEASDGKDALDILKKESVAAIFSDMEMPHVNGMELLAEINSDKRLDSPPVVIISSRQEDEFTSHAKRLGANNYLAKPLADASLDAAIAGIPALQHLVNHPMTVAQPSGEIR